MTRWPRIRLRGWWWALLMVMLIVGLSIQYAVFKSNQDYVIAWEGECQFVEWTYNDHTPPVFTGKFTCNGEDKEFNSAKVLQAYITTKTLTCKKNVGLAFDSVNWTCETPDEVPDSGS